MHFASHLPSVTWYPTDADPELLASINAWRHASDLPNLRPARWLDVLKKPWPTIEVDAVVNINMLQASPWEACPALFEGVAQVLRPGGVVVMYGPYKRAGKHTSESNASFDATVRENDPRWGVRNLEDVAAAAHARGLILEEVIEMPIISPSSTAHRQPTKVEFASELPEYHAQMARWPRASTSIAIQPTISVRDVQARLHQPAMG